MSKVKPAPLPPDTVIGGYRVVRRLAAGGFGVVYLATGADKQMVAMQAMHEKMAAAKTPEERKTLMAQHMKLMQGGMTMMKSMCDMADMQGGAGMKGSMIENQQMMDKCMAMMKKCMGMMETMMQMMMDGSPSVPAK